MAYEELSAIQLDALQEVGNIGSGNAATALSTLLNMKVDMKVPSINIVPFDDIFTSIGGDDVVVGVIVRVLGDIQGNMLFVFEKEEALYIIEALTGRKDRYVTEDGYSVLSEVGNIVASSYLDAISRFTGLNIVPSVPAVTYDMLGAILSNTFIESDQFDDSVLDVETVFLHDRTKVCGHFYYIPKPGSLDRILEKLGVR
jgi:chemotaxis protein CheC